MPRDDGNCTAVGLDRVFDALSDEHRRRLLVALLDESGPWTVGSLADVVAPDGDRDAARLRLVHLHLPKLANGGFVEWRRGADAVTPGPALPTYRDLLEWVAEHDAEVTGGCP